MSHSVARSSSAMFGRHPLYAIPQRSLRRCRLHQQTTRSMASNTTQTTQTPAKTSQASQVPPKKQPPPPAAPSSNPLTGFVAQVARSGVMRGATEPYAAYGGTEILFKECAKQADYTIPNVMKKPPEPAPKTEAGEDLGEGEGLWFAPKPAGGLGLPVTFISWAQVMYLHMYILTVRLRKFPGDHVRTWEQHLSDHFSYTAEDRMAKWHNMAARGVRNKNLKDLWLQWRGVLVSYDEGLIKGDAMLAAAIWRNVFKTVDNVDITDVALVTCYLRREIQRIDKLSDEEVAQGNVRFGSLAEARKALEKMSP